MDSAGTIRSGQRPAWAPSGPIDRVRVFRRTASISGLLLTLSLALGACRSPRHTRSISGTIRGPAGPLSGAVVRIRTADVSVTTDASGRFTIPDPPPAETLAITAWAPGYFIAGLGEVRPGAQDVRLELTPHGDADHGDYSWKSAFADAGDPANCENCHAAAMSTEADPGVALPFDDWRVDAHGQTLTNRRFLTMYLGTDVRGNQSPPTRYVSVRDYGRVPLRPDRALPYYGPGYKLDFPDTAGSCAACHAPAAAVDAPTGVDPTRVTGVGAESVACDFCHKVADVSLDPATGFPRPGMPGVLSFVLRRPSDGHQFFAGPFQDIGPVAPSHAWKALCAVCHLGRVLAMWPYHTEDTFVPVQSESRFCAPCHFGTFWETQIYNSFGEWLESPYSDPETGKTCQDCHMPSNSSPRFALAERGGLERDPESIFSHRMPGAADPELLASAVTMQTEARRDSDSIMVTVAVTNDNTGHDIPTDSPLRQMILIVEATDSSGTPLPLLEGPALPIWAGEGDPARGNFAGMPGVVYAKVLQELWTEVVPTGAYWNPTRLVSDTRLRALQTDRSSYRFQLASGTTFVRVRLVFRRAFKTLMDQKGWNDPDILMSEALLTVP